MQRWYEMRRYMRFDEADEAALASAREVLRPSFEGIVRVFYERILEHEGTRRVLTEGEAQIARLRRSLMDWLEGLFTGPWDASYFVMRSRIGRIHVRIGLEPRYMIAAMHLIRRGLVDAAEEQLAADPPRWLAVSRAIARICDMELATMLDLYADELSAQLKRRERLAAVGQLGASISHEVKNPLGVIASSLFALREHRGERADEVERRHFERLQRNVDQANEIVSSLLDFLRDRAPLRVPRDWAELVSGAVDEAPLPEGIRVERVLDPSSGRAAVDPVQVARVISNLVRNAAEASGEGGVVTVLARGDGDGVEVLVQDRGSGLPPVAMPQLFEPLFTTKQVGTGLGLALAKAIVDAHGGAITAANRDGGGAEFLVRLPRAPAPPPGFVDARPRPGAERAGIERRGP